MWEGVRSGGRVGAWRSRGSPAEGRGRRPREGSLSALTPAPRRCAQAPRDEGFSSLSPGAGETDLPQGWGGQEDGSVSPHSHPSPLPSSQYLPALTLPAPSPAAGGARSAALGDPRLPPLLRPPSPELSEAVAASVQPRAERAGKCAAAASPGRTRPGPARPGRGREPGRARRRRRPGPLSPGLRRSTDTGGRAPAAGRRTGRTRPRRCPAPSPPAWGGSEGGPAQVRTRKGDCEGRRETEGPRRRGAAKES